VADGREELVHRVAASAALERSPRLRELFLYICGRALQDRLDDLKEQAIGRQVFGRSADYSPGEDNIVRVEVRQLRKRLEEYFATEGKNEPVVIAIAKGGYVPAFVPREAPGSAVPMRTETAAPARRPLIGALFKWCAAALVVAAAAGGVWFGRTTPARARAAERGPIWRMLFDGVQQTTIVCADSTLVMAQAITHVPISLEEYVQRDYGKKGVGRLTPEENSLLHTLQTWQFTDVTDVRLVQRLARLNADAWDRVQVRSARTMQLQDFKTGNVVLLGSSHSNPWDQLFEPQLTFRFGFDFDPQQHSAYIRNTAPQAGEQAVYRAASPGGSGEVYATISLVPNLRHNGHVLIVAGTTAEGTETAGEFLVNPQASGALIRNLMARNKGQIPDFEVLLRSPAFAGVAQSAQVVALRILP